MNSTDMKTLSINANELVGEAHCSFVLEKQKAIMKRLMDENSQELGNRAASRVVFFQQMQFFF